MDEKIGNLLYLYSLALKIIAYSDVYYEISTILIGCHLFSNSFSLNGTKESLALRIW